MIDSALQITQYIIQYYPSYQPSLSLISLVHPPLNPIFHPLTQIFIFRLYSSKVIYYVRAISGGRTWYTWYIYLIYLQINQENYTS